jgi:hypothetical protein
MTNAQRGFLFNKNFSEESGRTSFECLHLEYRQTDIMKFVQCYVFTEDSHWQKPSVLWAYPNINTCEGRIFIINTNNVLQRHTKCWPVLIDYLPHQTLPNIALECWQACLLLRRLEVLSGRKSALLTKVQRVSAVFPGRDFDKISSDTFFPDTFKPHHQLSYV